ncbi:uncharacterized protein DUF3298 [Roseimicrobium gellanilyticum]|uniref:Uncharacterized protein DUF3298 n=1 Tax=Roseimicrobium gellanilyticum TaxID=748857 RepID=A0A366H7L3_9BACT|nr:RsiV family protein [Roseimicrobium gellanilyticum]RBP37727.1 uncharacterized protein DUF3298 [Roseimicrobium gellanilyticum]
MRLALFLSLLLTTATIGVSQEGEPEERWPDAFSRQYKGTIGEKLAIQMQLECEPTRGLHGGEYVFRGQYWYESKGTLITLWGNDAGWHEIKLDEQIYAGAKKGYEQTGSFSGKLNDDGTISGTWSDGEGKKKLPFTLTPFAPQGSARIKVHALESSWQERTTKGLSSLEHTATVVEVSGVKGAEKINQTLRQSVVATFKEAEVEEDGSQEEASKKKKPEKPATLEDISKAMLAERDDDMIANQEKWSLNYISGVRLNANGVLCTEHITSDYMGGAHPNSVTEFHTFDTNTGAELTLAALFKPEFLKALPKLGVEKLHKAEGLAPAEEIGPDAGLSLGEVEYEEGKFTWFLSPGGFVVHFNPYEVSAYARGNVQYTIPWMELKPWLTEKSPLHKFIP